jgi:transposase-like protein
MPWKASSVMEERLLDGKAMTDVCREFGVSRKTGYKIFDRYKEHGLQALTDRPLTTAGALCQPAAGTDRGPDCSPQGRETALGCAQDGASASLESPKLA